MPQQRGTKFISTTWSSSTYAEVSTRGLGIILATSCLAAEHHSCQAITAGHPITVSLATSMLEELCGIVCAHACCLPPIVGQKPVTGICTVTVGPDWVSDLSLGSLSALNKGITKPDQQQGAQVAIHLVVPVRGSTPEIHSADMRDP